MQKQTKTAFYLPVWHYTNKQRQLRTLWNYFERLANEGEVTWTRTEGKPFDQNGEGKLEAGVASRNAVFAFKVSKGKIVEGWLH